MMVVMEIIAVDLVGEGCCGGGRCGGDRCGIGGLCHICAVGHGAAAPGRLRWTVEPVGRASGRPGFVVVLMSVDVVVVVIC